MDGLGIVIDSFSILNYLKLIYFACGVKKKTLIGY
jgi:hypothetical protein